MRQVLCDEAPDARGLLSVRGGQYRHLVSVLRCQVGDMVHARCPDGRLVATTVCRIDDAAGCVTLQVTGDGMAAQTMPHAEPAFAARLWLFAFVAKPPRMELIVRQATECGAERIIPVAGEYCQKGSVQSAQKRIADGRWARIIAEAREQSGSPVQTAVHGTRPISVGEACALWQAERGRCGGTAICLYERTAKTVPLHRAVGEKPRGLAAIAVGAEGGISPAEFECLVAAGFTGVHFATNILRCETAALYGMAALQTALLENEVWQLKE